MKRFFFFVGALAGCMALDAAESITTRNGMTYTNAVIQRADPDGVVIEYAPQPGSVGIAKLKFANLPDELRKRYQYNATNAATFEQNQAAGIARRQEEILQGEIEKTRRDDEWAEQQALEAKREEMAPRNASEMETGGWYGGYYDDGYWYEIGHRRFRYNSRGPLNPPGGNQVHPHDGAKSSSEDSSGGVGLTGSGTGWGNSGHWGPLPSQAPGGPSHSGTFRGPVGRGNPSGGASQPGRVDVGRTR